MRISRWMPESWRVFPTSPVCHHVCCITAQSGGLTSSRFLFVCLSVCLSVTINIAVVVWCRHLAAKQRQRLTFCDTFCVFFYLLTRLLCNGWTDFHQMILHQQTSLRCYPLMMVPHENQSPQIFGAQNVHLLEWKFQRRHLRTAAAQKWEGILGKLKQLI